MKKTLFTMLLLITIALSVTIVACSNEVKKVAVTGVTLDETSITMGVNKTRQLTATIAPANASNKNVKWSVSPTGIVSVSDSGLVTSTLTTGTALVTVTTEDGNKTASCQVTVDTDVVPVDSVAVSPEILSLQVNGTSTLTVTVSPTSATDKSVEWLSSDETVATVSATDDTHAVVTAKKAGTTTITVKSKYDATKTASCAVTVTTAPGPAPSGNFITFSSNNAQSQFTLTIPYIFTSSLDYSTDAQNWTPVVATKTDYWSEAAKYISCTDLKSVGGQLYLRGRDNNAITFDGIDLLAPWKIKAESGVSVSGNIMTLLNCNEPDNKEMTSNNIYCFAYMFFNCTSLTDISGLILPATTLTDNCYYGMFQGCTNLTNTPELPATTLAKGCYSDMFKGCTSLTSVSDLPATTLEDDCYDAMFSGCTSLTKAPKLLATALANRCCREMFNGCTSLKVSENTGDSDKKIFTCPNSVPGNPVNSMFYGTTGTFTSGTPTSGNTYYWYIPDSV